jgi:hypothetical protein
MGMSNDGKTGFLSALQKAQVEERAVAVYAEGEGFERYEVGFVEDASLREVALRCLTTRGEPDGRRAIRTGDVVRIDVDTAYLRKLETLYEFRASVFTNDFPPTPTETGLAGQLQEAKKAQIVVHVVDENDYGPTGFVRHVGDESVEIDRVGPHGEADGRATMLLRAVAKVHVGRRQEQAVGFLHHYHSDLRRLIEG